MGCTRTAGFTNCRNLMSYSFMKSSEVPFRQAYGYNDNKIITYEWIVDTKLEIS
jgi:hypothetical protein